MPDTKLGIFLLISLLHLHQNRNPANADCKKYVKPM